MLTFPGLDLVRAWSFTLSPGIVPSVALVEIAPQFDLPAEIGTLVLSSGGVTLSFPGCAVDSATVRRDRTGMIVSLALLDRRRVWRDGQIGGRYNVRDAAGQLLPATEQSPRELATLLLTALGETVFDVSLLPDDTRPAIDWDYAHPATELARLAASLGCRVCLGLDGAVTLTPAGTGAALPVTGTELTRGFGIDPPSRPDTLLAVCGPTRFETLFRLEAVGQEPTGEIRRLNDLSYLPAGGWSSEAWPAFPNITDPAARAKARQTVYRWYRLSCTAPLSTAGQFSIAGYSGPVNSLAQLLPLEAARLTTYPDADGTPRAEPIEITGLYWDGGLDAQNIPARRRYRGSCTLDPERGLVQFAAPVVQLNPGGASGFSPAELYLTVAHGVRDATTGQPVRLTMSRTLSGLPQGSGPALLRRDDLALRIITTYDTNNTPTGATDNSAALADELTAQLDAAEAGYATRLTDYVEYAGLVPITPDGAITQVQWQESAVGIVTRASRNCEFSLAALS